MIIKQICLCISMLISATCIQALVLESELISIIDGTIVGWPSVHSIKTCQKKIRHFLKEHHTIDGIPQKFLDLAIKEKQGTITLLEKETLKDFIADFELFFEPFIIQLEPLKIGITPLVVESCQRRKRTNSLLLAWTKAPNGTTQELFRTHMLTYRALGELCMDLLNCMEDILSSCQKAVQAYQDFIDHYLKVEPLVDALLAADHVVLSHHDMRYHDLVKYIVEHSKNDEHITAEKTAKLYATYNIKKHL